jgi:hypothetical protein
MLVGKCPKCGYTYKGWALKSPWFQLCCRCGIDIDIWDSDDGNFMTYSSYTPDEGQIKQACDVPSFKESENG